MLQFVKQNVNKEVLPKDEEGKFMFGDTDYVKTWKVSTILVLKNCIQKHIQL